MRLLVIGDTRFTGRHLVDAGWFDVVVAPSAQGSADAALFRLLPLAVRASESGSG